MRAAATSPGDFSEAWEGPAIVGLTFVFADPDVERRFQSAMAVHNRRRLLAVLVVSFLLPFLGLAAQVAGLSASFMTPPDAIISAAQTVLSAAFIAAVWRVRSAAWIEALALAFGVQAIVANCILLTVFPPEGASSVLLGSLTLLYFGLPVRLIVLAPLIATASGAMLAAWFSHLPHSAAWVPLVEWAWVINLVGATGLRTMRYTLRRQWSQSQALRHLATHDGLTGVANRQYYDRCLANEWRRCLRAGAKLSVVVADIDFFKLLNDTIGHGAGDSCLRDIAVLLENCAPRPTDLLARTGGEEFAFLLPETDERGAYMLAQRVMAAVREAAIAHPNSPIGPHITLSLGVATACPYQGYSPWDLTALADRMLYAAKREGRNCLRQQSLGQEVSPPRADPVPRSMAMGMPSGD